MPKPTFRDTRPISKQIDDKKDEISKDYLSDPNKTGLTKRLAEKWGFPEATLRLRLQKWGLAKERDVVQLLAEQVPIKRKMVKLAANLQMESTFKDVQAKLEQFVKEHESSMHNHITQVHEHIAQHAATRPLELDDRLRWIKGVDDIARKLYGMTNNEEIDPSKRGVAMLAFGFQPQALQLPQNNLQGMEIEAEAEVVEDEEDTPPPLGHLDRAPKVSPSGELTLERKRTGAYDFLPPEDDDEDLAEFL